MASDHETEASPTDPAGGWRSPRPRRACARSTARSLVPFDAGFWRKLLRVCRPRLSGRGRLHGPGQLGDRPRRRRALRLHAAQRDHDLEPDGDPAAGARRARSASPAAATSRRRAATATRGRSTIALWILCEIAIAACDLAEVIGAAIALNLLFGLPLIWGVCITALDVLIVLFLQHQRIPLRRGAGRRADRRASPASFAIELWLAQPDPGRRSPSASFRASEILTQPDDALHRDRHPRRDGDAAQPVSALVDRADRAIYSTRSRARREAIRFATIDSSVALMSALFINARDPDRWRAAVFHGTGHEAVADIGDAYKLLSPLLGHDGGRACCSPSRCCARARTRR